MIFLIDLIFLLSGALCAPIASELSNLSLNPTTKALDSQKINSTYNNSSKFDRYSLSMSNSELFPAIEEYNNFADDEETLVDLDNEKLPSATENFDQDPLSSLGETESAEAIEEPSSSLYELRKYFDTLLDTSFKTPVLTGFMLVPSKEHFERFAHVDINNSDQLNEKVQEFQNLTKTYKNVTVDEIQYIMAKKSRDRSFEEKQFIYEFYVFCAFGQQNFERYFDFDLALATNKGGSGLDDEIDPLSPKKS